MTKRMYKKWLMIAVKVLVILAVLGLLVFNGYVFGLLRWKTNGQIEAVQNVLKEITKLAVEQKVTSFDMEHEGKMERVLCTLPRYTQQPAQPVGQPSEPVK